MLGVSLKAGSTAGGVLLGASLLAALAAGCEERALGARLLGATVGLALAAVCEVRALGARLLGAVVGLADEAAGLPAGST